MERRSSRRRGEASRATVNVLCCLTGEIHGSAYASLSKASLPEGRSLTHSNSGTDQLAMLSFGHHTQISAPPMALFNDNNPAVM